MDSSKNNMEILSEEAGNLLKNLGNVQVDTDKLPEVEKCIQSLDPKSLIKIKNSIDRESFIKEAVTMLEKLKQCFSEQEQDALSSFIDSVAQQVNKK